MVDVAQYVAEIVLGLGVIRPEVQGAPVTSNGLIAPSQVLQRVAEIVMRICVIGFELQRSAVTDDRLIVPLEIVQSDTEVKVNIGNVGPYLNRQFTKFDSLLRAPQLRAGDCSEVKSAEIPGRCLKDRLG